MCFHLETPKRCVKKHHNLHQNDMKIGTDQKLYYFNRDSNTMLEIMMIAYKYIFIKIHYFLFCSLEK